MMTGREIDNLPQYRKMRPMEILWAVCFFTLLVVSVFV